ncbi:MAG: T9SS type A sorting domain-containing protein, partial [Candidatus Cloacimonetes bacterium]|nr:T9SS type A sorting domain-containing protein [Candidatus Cloacimonadota bacterium]
IASVDQDDNEIIVTPGARDMVNGDIIKITDSYVVFDETTTIRHSEDGWWDGFYFRNSKPEAVDQFQNIIGGDISGILFIYLDNSNVNLTDCNIENIGRISANANSYLYLNNVDYHHNIHGIAITGSRHKIIDSEITYNSGVSAIDLQWSNNNQSQIKNTLIANNAGTGIQVTECFTRVTDTEITGNAGWGISSISNGAIYVDSGSHIHDNGRTEVFANHVGFPVFLEDHITNERPMVSDVGYIPGTLDQYLLYEYDFDPRTSSLNCEQLEIDTTDDSRFFPDISAFSFTSSGGISLALQQYYHSAQLFLQGDLDGAYDGFKWIVETFTDSIEAKKALSMMAYLSKMGSDSFHDLYDFLESIEEEYLQNHIAQVTALLRLYDEDYIEAITLYQAIIDNPPDEVSELLAELNTAFAYYQLVMMGSKKTVADAVHKPETYAELVSIQQDIWNRIYNLGNKDIETGEIPEVFENSLSGNYPNPFNPDTTIKFGLKEDSKVNISIYNIKGQKVRTLTNEFMLKGNHSVVWHGKDDKEKDVASGIYFYRMTTDHFTATKKMVLMK